ncbi:tyrosine-type recombinase/integrase [Candidatus Saccharibacteria bacterium]|nr:tyrosine-type recombinase/integrase [Candidatus Saccharibacteria bacterium]
MEKKDLSITEAFELYRVEQIVYKNESARTEEMHGLVLRLLLEFFGGDIPISELTFDQIRKWKEWMQKNKKPNTVRGYIIKLRVVIKHLQLKGYPVINHELIGIPKRDATVVDFLEVDEVKKLIQASFKKSNGYSRFKRYRNRAMLSLLYSSGIRNGELCAINACQIKPGDNTFTIIGKGNKPRLCFMDDETHKYIDEYMALRKDNAPALFISEQNKGARISNEVVQMVVKNCAEKAGLRKSVHPHTLRHTFATDLLRNNTNIVYVKEFLGHENIQTTMTYTHVVDEDLRAVHARSHTTVVVATA